MIRPNRKKDERGAVLITTILLMSVMTVITLAIMDDIRFSIKRVTSVQTAEQLDWYNRGGEEFAANRLGTQLDAKQTTLSQAILKQVPSVFPLEDGEMIIRVRDGQNCFNVNALSTTDSKVETQKQLALLLGFLDFDAIEAATLSTRIQDWVDVDNVPGQGGAEDYVYTAMTPAYRAANTVMADITELREIQDIDEETFRRLRPFLCALPVTGFSKININTLSPEQAPLLATVFAKKAGLRIAQDLIADRPLAGYDDIETVWAKEIIQDLELKGVGKELIVLKTERIDLQIDIRLGEQQRSSVSSFSVIGDNNVSFVSRRSRY
jgi:general secretion pathway protein K